MPQPDRDADIFHGEPPWLCVNLRVSHYAFGRAAPSSPLAFKDGLERCVGCELCAVACPADAIFVEAAENDPQQPVSHGERYARRYEINMLRCIFCGMCEEACPEDAIFLEKKFELSDYRREAFIYTKDELLVGPEKSGYLPQR